MAAMTTAAIVAGTAAIAGEATGQGWDYGLGEGIKNIFRLPEIPEPPKPEAQTMAGDEGIRRGEIKRQSKKRELKSLYLTRGQNRQPTLGEMKQTLG